jgi:hypothetical protein
VDALAAMGAPGAPPGGRDQAVDLGHAQGFRQRTPAARSGESRGGIVRDKPLGAQKLVELT